MARRKERLSCRKFDLPGQAGSLTENSEFLSFCDNRESVQRQTGGADGQTSVEENRWEGV